MTTPKQKFADDLADWERDHVKRWSSPVTTQHHQSATTMTTPNIAVASNITPTQTITHCVTKWTPPETLWWENSYSSLGDVVVNVAPSMAVRREDTYARLGDDVPIKNTQVVSSIPTPPPKTTTTHNNDNGGGRNFSTQQQRRNHPYNSSNMNTNVKNIDREGRPWFPSPPPPPPNHHHYWRDEFRPVNNDKLHANTNMNNTKYGESLGFDSEQQYGIPTNQQRDNISDRMTTYGDGDPYFRNSGGGGGGVGQYYDCVGNMRSDKFECSSANGLNALAPDVVPPSQRDNTPENDSNHKRVDCITRNDRALTDKDLDEIIKELETSTVLRETRLSNNLITLTDGKFTAALASTTSLQKIDLHNNKIGDEGALCLASALKVNNTLTFMKLNCNQISKIGAKFLAEALMVNTTLESIYLDVNKIGDEGVQSLAMSLKVNITLKSIDLSGCRISAVGAQFLAEALMVNTSLMNIKLSGNNIGDEGVQSLAMSLKVNKTLKSIKLGGNQISTVGAKVLAEALMVNSTTLESIHLNGNKIGDEGVQSLAMALKVNKTLNFFDISANQISTVGAKFFADALMVNTSLLSIKLNGNNIDDEGAQGLAESFEMNQSLCCIQLFNNKITDIGATKLANSLRLNCITKINLKGNPVGTGLIDRIESICKAKDRSKSKELSTKDITQTATQTSKNKKQKMLIIDTFTSKDVQIASLKEHIALLKEDIARLNNNPRHTKPSVETIDLTTNEAEPATQQSWTETDVKSNLAIMYKQNQKVVQIKQENAATKMALESICGEKNVVEADLKEVKEDLEDANELVGQMSLTTDIWQGRFDELVSLVESGNADGASINAIRNRPLGSGK